MSDEYLDALQNTITETTQSHGELGYYLVVVHAKGDTESFMGALIPRHHLYQHVIATVTDDAIKDGMSLATLFGSGQQKK